MKITTTFYESSPEPLVDGEKWDVAFLGTGVDHREESSCVFAKVNSKMQYTVDYLISERSLYVNDQCFENPSEISSFINIRDTSRILIDATSLSVPELFYIIRELSDLGISNFDVSYYEPQGYRRISQPNYPERLCFIKNYGLTDTLSDFIGIPGAICNLSDKILANVVFFTGYEADRIRIAFETQNLNPSRSHAVVGIPPFSFGMDRSNLSNNAKEGVFSECTKGGIHYCPANNPYLAYAVLEKIFKAVPMMVIAPLGTKPHGLASVLFCIQNKDVGLLYDHPEKSRNRSSNTGRLNIYHIVGLLRTQNDI